MWALSSYSFHYLFMVFKQPSVSNLKPHFFHLDISLKRSSNIPNWLSRNPTQSSLVNSELLFFITIQYTINMAPWREVAMRQNGASMGRWCGSSIRKLFGTTTYTGMLLIIITIADHHISVSRRNNTPQTVQIASLYYYFGRQRWKFCWH